MSQKRARRIAVALQKGGVGKTTTTQHLGHALARRGRSVLMLDLDPQGSLSSRYDTRAATFDLADVIGVDLQVQQPRPLREVAIPTHVSRIALAPGGQSLARSDTVLHTQPKGPYALDLVLDEEQPPFDYILIDTPPGKSKLLLCALVAADELIIPVQLSPMGFEGFAAIDEFVAEARDLQSIRGEVRLEYRAILPTFYAQGQVVSDSFLNALLQSEHPDYEGLPLPVATPVTQTTNFAQASAPRQVPDNGGTIQRALTIWEMPHNEVAERAGAAYQDLADMVIRYE